MERPQQLRLRIEAHAGSPSASRTAAPRPLELRRVAAAGRAGPEDVGEDRVVRRGIPGSPAERSSEAIRAPADSAARAGGGVPPAGSRPGPPAGGRTRGRHRARRAPLSIRRHRDVEERVRGRMPVRRRRIPLPCRPQRPGGHEWALSRRIAWQSRRSWHRATRTPASSRVRTRPAVSLHTQRGAPSRSRAAPSPPVPPARSSERPSSFAVGIQQARRATRRRRPAPARSRRAAVSGRAGGHGGSSRAGPSTRSPRHPPACSRGAAPTRT